jgi:glucokinase
MLAMDEVEATAKKFFGGDYITSTGWNSVQLKYMSQMLKNVTGDMSVEEYIQNNGLEKFYDALNAEYEKYKEGLENSISMGWADLED